VVSGAEKAEPRSYDRLSGESYRDGSGVFVHDATGGRTAFGNRIVAGRYGDLLDVAGFIDPALRVFIGDRSWIPAILNNRP